MEVFSLFSRCLGFGTILCFALAGCSSSNGNATPTNIQLLNTPTPTPTVLALASDIEETEPPPLEYTIEIQMPLEMSASEVVAEPGEGNTCIVFMPISISQEGERKMARGTTYIECHYTLPPDPLPYTIEIFNRFDASFDGEVFPPSESFPEGWIDGYLNVNGTTTQYYTDFKMEVPNLCPESSPCTVPGSTVFSLPFHLVDGYRIEQDWIFILHID